MWRSCTPGEESRGLPRRSCLNSLNWFEQRSLLWRPNRHLAQIALHRDLTQQLLQRTSQGDLAHDLLQRSSESELAESALLSVLLSDVFTSRVALVRLAIANAF